jgi:hypothetical protein
MLRTFAYERRNLRSPQVRERFLVDAQGFAPLVEGFEDHSLVLGEKQSSQGRVYLLTAFLNGANPQIQEWAYFNYFISSLVDSAAGRVPVSFAVYPASRVPHAREQLILFAMLGGLLVASGIAFWLVRRYSNAHPQALEQIVVDRGEFAIREANTDWEEIGFRRPLGGFFLALFLGLVLFIPLIIYQNLILPVYILPSAQALGIWGRVTKSCGSNLLLRPGLDFLRYGRQRGLHQVHVPIPGARPARGYQIRAGLWVVAGFIGGGASGDRGGAGWHRHAAHGLRYLCLECDHPHLHPDPGLLPVVPPCTDRLAAF